MKKMKNKNLIILTLVCLMCIGSVCASSFDTPQVKVILLNQDPDPVNSGDVVEVRFKIENTGTHTIEDFVIEILLDYPFSLYSGAAQKNYGKLIGSQDGTDSIIVDYKLRIDEDAVEGDNEIELRYTYGEVGTWWIIKKDLMIDIEVEEVNFQLGSLQTEPTRLVSDTEDAKFSIELQNIGDGKAENVMAQIILPEGFRATYGYSDISNLGTIDAESSKIATFYIDVDEAVKENGSEATLIIKYKEDNDKDNKYKEKNISIMIPIKATPLFEIVEIETIPQEVKAGDTVDLRLIIKNTGSKKAESVSIKAFKEASQPFEFDEKSDFIGVLKSGQTGEAVLKFTVEKDATAKTYLLDTEIRTINKEDVLVFEKSVPVKVVNHQKKGIITKEILIGMIIILAIVGGGLIAQNIWNKRRKK
ncbi:MAG: hypothetical protein KAS15_04085 [Nanoarchaeota archaeon]|nr:hypothetical protein [Nanoarchaeota archaeon]MCK5629608.1 hypothetical protein [Nanoarchaeota archaeon]